MSGVMSLHICRDVKDSSFERAVQVWIIHFNRPDFSVVTNEND